MSLLDDTHRVRERTTDLQQNLAASARDTRRLQNELEVAQGQAQIDPLTGLLSRRGFEYRLRDEFAAGLPAGALLRVDVDQFSAITDGFGHVLADRVLATIGQIISTNAVPGALVARAGGEQYLLLLPGGPPTELSAVAERIRVAIERCRIRRQDTDTSVTTVTVSIGMIALSGGEPLAAMVERADQAVARAKQQGGNRITVGDAQS